MYKKIFQNNSYAEVEHCGKTIIYKTFTSDGKKTSQLLRPTANALEVGACNCPVV